jgi:hypothetical protein
MGEAYAGVHAQHDAGGVKACGAAAQEPQLRTATLRIARFVQRLIPGGCHLIGANDQGIGALLRDGPRLLMRKP